MIFFYNFYFFRAQGIITVASGAIQDPATSMNLNKEAQKIQHDIEIKKNQIAQLNCLHESYLEGE